MTMTQAEMQDRIIAKAGEDDEFRTRLVADPKRAIEGLTGTTIPDAFTVQVHEESATTQTTARNTSLWLAMVYILRTPIENRASWP